MDGETGKKSLPPYVSYRTFLSFIDDLRTGMPSRIDRSFWGERYSGSTGTQLMTGLRFMGLIDGSGVPTIQLRQLVSATGTQRNEVLKQIARNAFSFITERSLNPEVATYAQLEEAFSDTYQMTGDVTRKCIKFFISLLNDARVPLSPYIVKRSKTMRSRSVKKGTIKKTDTRTNKNLLVSSSSELVPSYSAWNEMVLAKFPNFDPAWSDDIKLKWFEAFDLLLKRGQVSASEK